MNKIILILCAMILLSGCAELKELYGIGQPESAYGGGISAVSICKLNGSPSIFLYPAIDYESEEPKFFENTTYEILKEGRYMGKFKADRFNESYLNISAGEELDMIISAQDEKCEVLNQNIRFRTPCKPIEFIQPEMRCAEIFESFTVYDIDYNPLQFQNWTVTSTYSPIRLTLDIPRSMMDYSIIGCSYDDTFINNYGIAGLPVAPTNKMINWNYKIWNAFEYHKDGEYRLEFYFNDYITDPTDVNVTCTFFDRVWGIENYQIIYSSATYNGKDWGQENLQFNFTIKYRP